VGVQTSKLTTARVRSSPIPYGSYERTHQHPPPTQGKRATTRILLKDYSGAAGARARVCERDRERVSRSSPGSNSPSEFTLIALPAHTPTTCVCVCVCVCVRSQRTVATPQALSQVSACASTWTLPSAACLYYTAIGDVFCESHDNNLTQTFESRVICSCSGFAKGYSCLGEACLRLNKISKCIEACKKCLELDPLVSLIDLIFRRELRCCTTLTNLLTPLHALTRTHTHTHTHHHHHHQLNHRHHTHKPEFQCYKDAASRPENANTGLF
jgi:hypothetical protein